MFKSLLSVFTAASIVISSFTPSFAMTGENGQIYYRYKTPDFVGTPDNPEQTKDILAYYVGGIGADFSERLPMKTIWQKDDWRVVGGELPDGISFDPATLTFSGTPTSAMIARKVSLEGFDSNGKSVAKATANFDIYAIEGVPVHVNAYGHTGKYKLEELALPADISVYSWKHRGNPPPGMEARTSYFEGVPTSEGNFGIFSQGVDYNGKVLVTFYGSFLVEDGPTFPAVADAIHPLPQMEWGYGLVFNFGPPSVGHLIDETQPARYFVELSTGESYPGNVASNGNAKSLRIAGTVKQPYETAKIRWKAIDSDDTVGYSDWFTFGSSNPQPSCNPYSPQNANYPLTFTTGKVNNVSIPRPYGMQGVANYTKVSGDFPSNIALDAATGRLSGTPIVSGEKTEFVIKVDVVNPEGTVSAECHYFTKVVAGATKVADTTPQQDRHIRLGDVYTGSLSITGGIPDYTVGFSDDTTYPEVSLTSPVKNVSSATVAGPIRSAGQNKIELKLYNGDGSDKDGVLSVYAHPELSMSDIPTVTVKRLEASKNLLAIPYDTSSVIPDVALGNQPGFVFSGPGLPSGLSVRGDYIWGATAAAAGTYGPFTLTMSDYSGDTLPSNAFDIVVEPREPIAINPFTGPTFPVENPTELTLTPAKAVQPPGAADFKLEWTLNGQLPSWLTFDRDTGAFTAQADIPYSTYKTQATYGPFTVTVTDEDNSTATSEPFNVTLTEKENPKANIYRKWEGNIGGSEQGETSTPIAITGLSSYIDEATIYGSRDDVKFLAATPPDPAGLAWDPALGQFSGVPSREYNGTVKVDFEDIKGRTGTMDVPLAVIPYPAPVASAITDIPRLSEAETLGIVPTAVVGFWDGQQTRWSLDTARGTDITQYGLSVNASNGAISGYTTSPVGTVISDVVIKSTSRNPLGQSMDSWIGPFDLKITAQVPMTLSYKPDQQVYYMRRTAAGLYELRSTTRAYPTLKGSYRKPVTFNIDLTDAYAAGLPAGFGIGQTGMINGTPDKPGIYSGLVSVQDTDGTPNENGQVSVGIKFTLEGQVAQSTGVQRRTLRVGEPFALDPVSISNEVRPVVFQYSPATVDATATSGFDPLTGGFSDESHFDTKKSNYQVTVTVKDAHDRTFQSSPIIVFNVLEKPVLSLSPSNLSGRQYSPSEPILATFGPKVTNVLGEITYSLSGDIPGSKVDLNYGADGLSSYDWTDGAGRSHTLEINGGVPGLYRVDGVAQSYQMPAGGEDFEKALWNARLFPADALFFDTRSATLRGIPSRAGTFMVDVTAHDSHAGDYIKDVSTRIPNNTSLAQSAAITVSPAHDLSVANNANSETVALYTSQPTLTSTLSNSAYGFGIASADLVSGALPTDVKKVLTDSVLSYGGYPQAVGSYPGIVWKLKDAAGRTIDTSAVTMTVGPRSPLVIVPPSPITLAVNIPSNLKLTATGLASGQTMPASDWTITGQGNLPPGLVATAQQGGVLLSGTPTKIGSYSGITVSTRDIKGMTATSNITIDIDEPSGDIDLEVASPILTKVGYPFEMLPKATNTYGTQRFYSYDLTGGLSGQVALDRSSGLVSGKFSTVGDTDFDVYVSDATNRVTSKPVVVKVLPPVRVTVPVVVQAQQGKSLNRTVTTDYVLGTVNYEKGNPSAWPVGFDVDPMTGEIRGSDASSGTLVNNVIAAPGDYGGLTIRAVDTFTASGATFADSTTSEPFTLRVTPSDAIPVITTPTKTILGTQNAAIVAWRPVVKEKSGGKAWNYGGTVYTFSEDLTQYGLSVDQATGIVSGTPTKPFVIRNLTVTVTSARGDSSVTSPFWMGVAPAGTITPSASQKTSFTVRAGAAFKSDPLAWDNVVGNLTHVRSGGSSSIAISAADGVMTSNTAVSWGVSSRTTNFQVTDEFSRKGVITVELKTMAAITATAPSVRFDYGIGGTLTATAANLVGTPSFEFTGLPADASYDAQTGVVTIGTAAEDMAYTYTVKVTDSSDNASGTASGVIKIVRPYDGIKYRYWKVDFVGGPGTAGGHGEITEIEMLDENGVNVAREPTVVLGSSGPYFATSAKWGKIEGMVNGDRTVDTPYFGVKAYDNATARAYVTLTFDEPKAIHQVDVWSNNFVASYRTSKSIVYASENGTDWKEIYASTATTPTTHESMP